MRMRRLAIASAAVALAALVATPAPAAGGAATQIEEGRKEVYTGTLVGIGGRAGGRTATFTLTINSYVPPQQAAQYVALLRSKGQDALLEQLDDRDIGSFALAGQVRRTVNFAYAQTTPEGRRLTILFERWLQPFEIRYGTRSQDYPFTYLEISIDKNGRGSGTMIGAAKVYFEKDDPSTLNVENFSTYPLRVVNVELER